MTCPLHWALGEIVRCGINVGHVNDMSSLSMFMYQLPSQQRALPFLFEFDFSYVTVSQPASQQPATWIGSDGGWISNL